MKSKLRILLVFTLLFTVISSSTVFASQGQQVNGFQSREKKIQEMVNDGVTLEDANFILDLEQKLSNTDKKIVIDDNTPTLTDAQAKNKKEFQEKCMALDPVSLKKSLMSKAHLNGPKDLEELIKRDGGSKEEYKIEYSDGSWITTKSSLIKLDTPSETGVTTNGYSEYYMDGGVLSSDGNYQLSYEMVEFSGASYSKTKILSYFTATGLTRGYGSTSMQFTGKEGFQSAYGIITCGVGQTYYLPDNGTATGIWSGGRLTSTSSADAVNQVTFTASGSLSLVGTIGVNVGASWTQYARIRIFGSGIWNKYAGIYV